MRWKRRDGQTPINVSNNTILDDLYGLAEGTRVREVNGSHMIV